MKTSLLEKTPANPVPLRFIMLMALALGACSQTPPPKLHVLSPSATALTPIMQPSSGRARVIVIGPVGIPEYLDRREIVQRRSANSLVYDADNVWAESLRSGIQRVLAADLAGRLVEGFFVVPGTDRVPDADFDVPINIENFEKDDTGRVVMSVRWELRNRPTDRLIQRGRRIYVQPVAAEGFEAQIAAMDASLRELAVDLADTVRKTAR